MVIPEVEAQLKSLTNVKSIILLGIEVRKRVMKYLFTLKKDIMLFEHNIFNRMGWGFSVRSLKPVSWFPLRRTDINHIWNFSHNFFTCNHVGGTWYKVLILRNMTITTMIPRTKTIKQWKQKCIHPSYWKCPSFPERNSEGALISFFLHHLAWDLWLANEYDNVVIMIVSCFFLNGSVSIKWKGLVWFDLTYRPMCVSSRPL